MISTIPTSNSSPTITKNSTVIFQRNHSQPGPIIKGPQLKLQQGLAIGSGALGKYDQGVHLLILLLISMGDKIMDSLLDFGDDGVAGGLVFSLDVDGLGVVGDGADYGRFAHLCF